MGQTPREVVRRTLTFEYLRSLAEVPEHTVNRIVFGQPDAEITKDGTCWLPYWKTCREAVEH